MWRDIFNIKFTSLKIVDVTWYFWFNRVIQKKTQYKCKLHLAKYSNCNIEFSHSTNMIPITDLCNMLSITMLGLLSHQQNICGLEPGQAHCTPQNSVASCLIFIFCVGMGHIFTPPMLIWDRHFHTVLTNSGRIIYTTSWSTQLLIAVYLKQRSPSSPFFVEIVSFFTTAVVVTPCIIPWAPWAHCACPSPLSLLPW